MQTFQVFETWKV